MLTNRRDQHVLTTPIAGVSLITQVLYIVVFLTRYLDLFWRTPADSLFLFTHKIFYISASAFVVFLMTRVYPRTREREKAWKLGASCLIGAVIAAYPMTLANVKWTRATFVEVNFRPDAFAVVGNMNLST